MFLLIIDLEFERFQVDWPLSEGAHLSSLGWVRQPFFKAERMLEASINVLLLMTWDFSENTLFTPIARLKYPPF